ncbi:hypothetical protein AWB68_08053 [Caballeronia choica]|uniref:Uncharacterized protein n=1 Tax=Caballeronia choica TaxID=326476 RepID=A0A158KZG8_9BURK|nr:hypothetical protein AWB68_08053 [Caballeronia choica]
MFAGCLSLTVRMGARHRSMRKVQKNRLRDQFGDHLMARAAN